MTVEAGAVPIVRLPLAAPVVSFTSRRPEPPAPVTTAGTSSPPPMTAVLLTTIPTGAAGAPPPPPPPPQPVREITPISRMLKKSNLPPRIINVCLRWALLNLNRNRRQHRRCARRENALRLDHGAVRRQQREELGAGNRRVVRPGPVVRPERSRARGVDGDPEDGDRAHGSVEGLDNALNHDPIVAHRTALSDELRGRDRAVAIFKTADP